MSRADHREPRTPQEELLSAKEVAAKFGISRRTLRKWVSEGTFPKPARFNRTVIRWKASVVEAKVREAEAAGSAA